MWCGARKGRSVTSDAPGSRRPATECTLVTSIASSTVRGGNSPTRRRASIVLPAPGGPSMRIEWRPAAAISSARRAEACPRTSAMSGSGPRPAAARRRSASLSQAGTSTRPSSTSTACRSERTPTERRPPTSAASRTFASGTSSCDQPRRRACSARASTPATGRSAPSSASSPTAATPPPPSSWPDARRSASAIGRSYWGPAFLRSAGARFTTTRRGGIANPWLASAERTRSRDSCTAASGSPTTANAGRPARRSTSTLTVEVSRPRTAGARIDATTGAMMGGAAWRITTEPCRECVVRITSVASPDPCPVDVRRSPHARPLRPARRPSASHRALRAPAARASHGRRLRARDDPDRAPRRRRRGGRRGRDVRGGRPRPPPGGRRRPRPHARPDRGRSRRDAGRPRPVPGPARDGGVPQLSPLGVRERRTRSGAPPGRLVARGDARNRAPPRALRRVHALPRAARRRTDAAHAADAPGDGGQAGPDPGLGRRLRRGRGAHRGRPHPRPQGRLRGDHRRPRGGPRPLLARRDALPGRDPRGPAPQRRDPGGPRRRRPARELGRADPLARRRRGARPDARGDQRQAVARRRTAATARALSGDSPMPASPRTAAARPSWESGGGRSSTSPRCSTRTDRTTSPRVRTTCRSRRTICRSARCARSRRRPASAGGAERQTAHISRRAGTGRAPSVRRGAGRSARGLARETGRRRRRPPSAPARLAHHRPSVALRIGRDRHRGAAWRGARPLRGQDTSVGGGAGGPDPVGAASSAAPDGRGVPRPSRRPGDPTACAWI